MVPRGDKLVASDEYTAIDYGIAGRAFATAIEAEYWPKILIIVCVKLHGP